MWFTAFFQQAWLIVIELAPWLFLGAVIAGLLHRLVSDAWLERMLRGRWGVVRAVLFGVPMPLCSCGVIPAGISLKQRGASDSAAIAFMISTPQTGVDSVLVSASFLGWPFALFKVGAAAVLGLVGGWLTPASSNANEATREAAIDEAPRDWRAAFDHGVEIIRSIWGWLTFGILASAALGTLVPTESLAAFADASGAWAIVAVLALSVPLYVCATASVPIAAALVAGGFPAGAALVFLLAGPATNLATMGAVYRAFGAKTLAIYLGTIIVGSVALGLLFSDILVQGQVLDMHQHHASWWEIAAAVLLVAMIAVFAVQSALPKPKLDSSAKLIELGVDGMTCQGCVRKLEKHIGEASEAVDGSSFEVQLDDGGFARATGLSEDLLARAIEAAGFRVRAQR